MSKDMASFSINYNDVVNLKAILNEGGLEEFYRYLADKGDRYSLAAPGSYNEHSFLSRLYFHYGLDVYSDELKYMYLREKLYRVQQDLAKEYMVLIESKFKNNMDKRGVVNISSEDIYKHYMNVLEKNNMFMGYWDTNIAMLFFTTEERGEYWDSKLNNSDSFKGQVIHYFKTINFLLDIYDKFTDKKGTPIAWYLKNNYNLFMYERGYELIEEQKDIILKDKNLCDLIYTVHMKYVKYKDEIDIKIGNVHDLINYQENELFYSDKIDLKNKIKLEVLEKDINNRRKKRSVGNYTDEFVTKKDDAIRIYEEFKKIQKSEVIYDYLESEGSKYAVIANGLIKEKSLSGKVASNFIDTELKKNGINESKIILDKLKLDLAEDTLLTFISRSDSDGVIRGDLTSQETQHIHHNAFERNGISRYGWTLTIPYQILPESRHKEIHLEMLKSAGNDQAEFQFSIYLSDEMFLEIIKNPKIDSIKYYTNWGGTLLTIDNIKEAGAVFGDYFVESGITLKEDIAAYVNELKKVIPKSDLDIYGVESKISQTKTQPINQGAPSTPPIKYPHNMVDKSILESTYPKSEPNRQLAPRTTNLLDRFKDNETPTNYYLERPSVVLPETPGFKDFPTDTIRNNPHFENMIGQLRDNMSSMNNSMDSFEDKYSIPSMPSIPEFSYSGYSSGGSFSFN
ncbi:hypothetical protein AB6G46_15540 [Providencia hangzhouensis]|uniref:hypothetical protein n=1 Tax=Providencia hangzhouensis TaxID=3031799 RepID=UPI0034DD0236